jgi:hypothetical protein
VNFVWDRLISAEGYLSNGKTGGRQVSGYAVENTWLVLFHQL